MSTIAVQKSHSVRNVRNTLRRIAEWPILRTSWLTGDRSGRLPEAARIERIARPACGRNPFLQ
jgi:hypothetical protein